MSSTPTVPASKLPTKCCNFVGNSNSHSNSFQTTFHSIGPFMVTIGIIFVISLFSSWLLRKKCAQHSRDQCQHNMRTEQDRSRTNQPGVCITPTITLSNLTWLRPWRHLSTNSNSAISSACSSLSSASGTCPLAWRELLAYGNTAALLLKRRLLHQYMERALIISRWLPLIFRHFLTQCRCLLFFLIINSFIHGFHQLYSNFTLQSLDTTSSQYLHYPMNIYITCCHVLGAVLICSLDCATTQR